MTPTQQMAATREVRASCQQIWDAMADGWTYSQWVVGNSRTRAVDSTWPQPGAAIKHSASDLSGDAGSEGSAAAGDPKTHARRERDRFHAHQEPRRSH